MCCTGAGLGIVGDRAKQEETYIETVKKLKEIAEGLRKDSWQFET